MSIIIIINEGKSDRLGQIHLIFYLAIDMAMTQITEIQVALYKSASPFHRAISAACLANCRHSHHR